MATSFNVRLTRVKSHEITVKCNCESKFYSCSNLIFRKSITFRRTWTLTDICKCSTFWGYIYSLICYVTCFRIERMGIRTSPERTEDLYIILVSRARRVSSSLLPRGEKIERALLRGHDEYASVCITGRLQCMCILRVSIEKWWKM